MWTKANIVLLGTGLASFVLLGMSMSLMGPVLPVFSARFGQDISTTSWLLSVFWVGCLLGVGAIYFYGQSMGPRSGLALSAVGATLIATMFTWSTILLGSTLFGAGYGVLAAVYNPRLLTAFGARGPAMMSMGNATFTIGAIAAPQLFLMLGSEPGTVYLLFAAYAAAIFLAAGAAGNAGVDTQTEASPLRVDWPIMVLVMFGIGMESSLVGLGPAALIIAGSNVEQAADLLSWFFVAYLCSRIALIFIAQRLPAFPMYVGSMAITAAICLGAIFGDAAFWFPLLGFPAGFYFFGGFMTGMARMGGTARASAVSLAAGLIGSILQPTIIAQGLDSLGPKGFFVISFAIAACLVVVSAALLPRMMGR